jgi:hypothetical protein
LLILERFIHEPDSLAKIDQSASKFLSYQAESKTRKSADLPCCQGLLLVLSVCRDSESSEFNKFHPKTPLPHSEVEREGSTPLRDHHATDSHRMPLGLMIRPAARIVRELPPSLCD